MPVSTTPNILNTMQNDEKATSNKYVYQVWKGSNRFFLNGRLVFGPDVRSLVVTLFLIIVPAILFCVFVARHLLHKFPNNGGVAIMVMTVMYTIYVLFLLLLTSGRDPGIVPRSRHPPEPEEDAEAASAEWGGSQTPRFRLPRTKDVIVNGVTVKTKYCDTCMLYRPPRCSHCSICNNCVERFDHHCPWVGQCIGKRNYRFFFMFVSSTTVLCIYVFAMSALYIKLLMNDGHYTVWRAMGKSPASVLLMAYTFIAVWFVGGLTFFHLYLIITNQTTYENFRYRYENKVNPYNLGTVSNFKEIFCSPIPPSKNRFRSRADEEVQSPPTPNLPPVGRTSPNVKHQTVEASKPPAWPIIGKDLISDEALEELHTRISNVGDIGLEPKDGLDTFAHAFNQLPFEATETTVASRSSRGSGNWEITTNTTLDSGDKVEIEVNRVPSNAPALPGEINAG